MAEWAEGGRKRRGQPLKVEMNDGRPVDVVELSTNDFITASLSQRVTRGDEGKLFIPLFYKQEITTAKFPTSGWTAQKPAGQLHTR